RDGRGPHMCDRADAMRLDPGLEQGGDLVLKATGDARCADLHALGPGLAVAAPEGFHAASLVEGDHGGGGLDQCPTGRRPGVEVEVSDIQASACHGELAEQLFKVAHTTAQPVERNSSDAIRCAPESV